MYRAFQCQLITVSDISVPRISSELFLISRVLCIIMYSVCQVVRLWTSCDLVYVYITRGNQVDIVEYTTLQQLFYDDSYKVV